MKVALAQINVTIGDFPGNAKRLLNAYREAVEKGADLVLTPELSLVGYPPRDLVFKSNFVSKCLQALDYLAGEIGAIPLIVGYVDHTGDGCIGKPFRNAAAFLWNGAIYEKRFKTLLPSYDVFDERRYYEPSESSEPIEWNGRRIGLTICEDLWTEEYLPRPLYQRNPIKELVEKGADCLLNLSASPFHQGKVETRRELLSELAKSYQLPLFYCNAVAGSDQLIFDGHSVAVNAKGEIIEQLKGFEEHIEVVGENAVAGTVINLCDEGQMFEALVLGLRDYGRKCGFTQACLGLSGGIDSALTASIAVKAFGAHNVRGITMPSEYSSPESVKDSYALAENLGMRCDEFSIQPLLELYRTQLTGVLEGAVEGLVEENIQARLRGLTLMSLANKEGSLLLTTGNKSELAVGYCTMYGDMCGGLAVISDLPKMQVYALSKWLNKEQEMIPWNTINKAPSAELRPDQRDQDTLPPYPELDLILELYIEKHLSAEEITAFTGYEEQLVHWVIRRVDLNEWKRYQAAPGLRVTSKAFGMGRRVPIAQQFKG